MKRIRALSAGFAVFAALVGTSASAAEASRLPQRSPTAAPSQRLLTATPPLQVTLGYAKLEIVVDQPLARAKVNLVPLGINYVGNAPVAFVQVPGVVSYPIGPFAGSFQHTIGNADVRALLKQNETQIITRCRSTLDTSQVDVVDTTHDVTLPLIVTGADGAVVATTDLAYQVGLTCKNPLAAKIGYAKIELNINQTLAQAKAPLVPLTLSYLGSGQVSWVMPGSVSYSLGARQGSFEQTLPNTDIRAILKRDEAAIISRCKSTLDYKNVSASETVHDTRIPVTVNAADGTVVASTNVRYQLGLTCKR